MESTVTTPEALSAAPSSFVCRSYDRGVLLGSVYVFVLFTGFASTFSFAQARRDELGCGAACIGAITSASSALRLVGAVLIGRLSDRLGRRPMLWLALFGCAMSVAISLTLDSLLGLWLSMVPSSLLNQNNSVLKALFSDYATDVGATEVERASGLGRLGMAFGISFIAGPVLAMTVVTSYYQSLVVSGVCTALSGIFVALLPAPRVAPASDTVSKRSFVAGVVHFLHPPVMSRGGARLVVALRLFAGLAFHVFQVIWSVSLKERFAFGPQDYATFMGIVGWSYALSQGLIAKQLIKYCNGNTVPLALACVVLLGLGRPIALWTLDLRVVYAMFCAMVVALGVLNTLITSACSSIASQDELGGLFGILDATENLTGIVGPLLGGVLTTWGQGVPLALVVACYVVNYTLIACFFRRHVILPGSKTTKGA